ncbi:FHA domain-containing protein [Protaetiibacter intestinalis]|uniref:FHA domain-containing protein n=1 Tax=Protaetiibacter intestinalis TaxID=2419774 RepID=A0A387B7K8_9MICO|nr:FHA domain-containing protein [Protaetiibacter intestinalis]
MPILVPEPEPIAAPAPEPVPVSIPEPEPEPQPEPVPEPAPEPLPAPVLVPEPEDEEDEDHTVVVERAPKVVWELVTEDGERLRIPSDRVVLGRRPSDPGDGSVALAVPDPTKTLSKVHARLERGADDAWTITDLGSTNGVIILAPDGAEQTLEPNATARVEGSFVLGKLTLRIERSGGAG